MNSIHFRFPTDQQEFIWQKSLPEISLLGIAQELQLARKSVSMTQRIAEERVEKILLQSASANHIKIRHIIPRYGFGVYYYAANKSPIYIVYAPAMGTQVWFSHGGSSSSCSEQSVCEKKIYTLVHEWNFPLTKGIPATEVVEDLFIAIMRRLKWNE